MNFPKTRKKNVVEKIAGHKINDPYRWLENSDNKEVKNWIKEQNKYTESGLKSGVFKVFQKELAKDFEETTFSNPYLVKGKYFYSEKKPGENHAVYYFKKGLNGRPIKLIDPNGMNKNDTVSCDFHIPSRSGNHVAYGLSQGGNEMADLYIKNVNNGKNLPDKIINVGHTSLSWLPNDSGFFYTRYPRPNTVPKGEEHLHRKIYFHKLGNDAEKDELIFGKDRPKDDMIGISLSVDGHYLSIYVSHNWTENEIYVFDAVNKKIIPLITGVNAKFVLWFSENAAFILTNYKANNYRVVSMPIEKLFTPIKNWKEIIPENKYIIEGFGVSKDKLIVEYMKNVSSVIFTFNHSGKNKKEIPTPPYSSIAGISPNREEKEFFYGVQSFLFPKITYRYNPESKNYIKYRETKNPIKSADYEVKQEWYESKDKTRVPMFIINKREIVKNGKNPTILYGYGGFSVSETPCFSKGFIPWIKRGGIYAIANIRGGSEFGNKWHKDGIKENKQNSFDDFIAGAEYLISKKYTDKNHIGIMGGSNGGLLASAVATQRPKLFKAVCSMVPLTDMVRFPKFGMAMRWVNEYGDPKIKKDLKNILKWSPYHNVKSGTEYPNFLFTTAEKDSRVHPLHARKMAATLQSANKENNIFIFTEKEAGHASGRPIYKVVELRSFILAFFAKYLDLRT
jgi:prolyl oligopeptidase